MSEVPPQLRFERVQRESMYLTPISNICCVSTHSMTHFVNFRDLSRSVLYQIGDVPDRAVYRQQTGDGGQSLLFCNVFGVGKCLSAARTATLACCRCVGCV